MGETRWGRRKLVQVALPAAVAVTPVLVGAARAWSNRAGIWFWGDQALIDIEARNSLSGHNLVGVYDRYGWHHLGPLWLQVLGLFRWLGGGSAVAVAFGFYALQALAVVGIVMVAYRLRPGLTAWWAALVLLGYEWSFGLERLGTVWARTPSRYPPRSWSCSWPKLPLAATRGRRRSRPPCAGLSYAKPI